MIKQDRQCEKKASTASDHWSLDKNKDDPVKCITITRYYPVLLSSLTALTENCMMNFADLLAVNRKKKSFKLPLTPSLFFFSNYFCVTYVKPEV